jgi:hypothetical protein
MEQLGPAALPAVLLMFKPLPRLELGPNHHPHLWFMLPFGEQAAVVVLVPIISAANNLAVAVAVVVL